MKIDEAIKILEPAKEGYLPTVSVRVLDAVKLGIEALKRVKKYRPLYAGKYPHLLPGETEE